MVSTFGPWRIEPIIEAQGLTKRFTVKKKTVEAVTDLTFQVDRGELVAFLGPNGAGKSTSLRMLTTLIPPTAGTARVVGYDILKRPADVRARIGYVGQLTSGSFAQRVRDELLSQGAFYGMSKRRGREAGGRAHRVARPRELLHPDGAAAERRPEAAARRRARTHARPAAAVPRRALDRARPAEPRESVAAHPRPARAARHDRVPHDALPRGGRPLRRAGHGDGQGARDRRRHRRRGSRPNSPATCSRSASPRTADAERAVAVVQQLTDREVRREGAASVALTAPDGDALLPAAVRALDAAGIRVARATGVPPTLDDVFLALTGRTLREAGEGEPTPKKTTKTTTGCHGPKRCAHPSRQEPSDDHRDLRADPPRHRRARQHGSRHLERADARAQARRARPVHADLQPRAAARVPRAVRPAAGRLVRVSRWARPCSGSCPACW